MKRAMLMGAAAVAVCGGMLVAGPLDPPAGPIAGTGKTLSEIEPRVAINAVNTPGDATGQFRITKPGSYYLTDNVQGVSGKDGIVIAASNVSIDLHGFALLGVAGSGAGIRSEGSSTSLRVCNGTVSGWADAGVTFVSAAAVIESMVSSGNKFDGFLVGDGSTVRGCIANNNGGNGILTGAQCVLSNCVTKSNSNTGIVAAARSQVLGCVAGSNSGGGISGSFGTSVLDCNSSLNVGVGIVLQSGGRVTRCIVTLNGFHGIAGESDGTITDNTVRGNGTGGTGTGIVTSADDNVIEGNNVTDNKIGVQVFGGGNIISRNRCSGNTQNWNIAAGNKCLVVLGANCTAFSGDSGGTPIGSTDLNANFTY